MLITCIWTPLRFISSIYVYDMQSQKVKIKKEDKQQCFFVTAHFLYQYAKHQN